MDKKTNEDLKDLCSELGIIPINTSRILEKYALDINAVVSYLREKSDQEIIDYYKDKYDIDVVLFDTSRNNLGGISYNHLPIYKL